MRCSFCLDEINKEYKVGVYVVCEDCYETFYSCDVCGEIIDARFTEIYEDAEMCIDCYKKIKKEIWG